MADNRFRNWTFILYPESMIKDCFSYLEKLNVPIIVSPLHDKDINEDGSPKKPHYHVGLFFEGKQSYQSVQEIANYCNGTMVERVRSVKGLVRYMGHLDNPDKHRYDLNDCICYGGFDYTEVMKPTKSETLVYISQMQEYIQRTGITEFSDLMDIAKEKAFDTWYYCLCFQCANVMEKYLKSYRFKH